MMSDRHLHEVEHPKPFRKRRTALLVVAFCSARHWFGRAAAVGSARAAAVGSARAAAVGSARAAAVGSARAAASGRTAAGGVNVAERCLGLQEIQRKLFFPPGQQLGEVGVQEHGADVNRVEVRVLWPQAEGEIFLHVARQRLAELLDTSPVPFSSSPHALQMSEKILKRKQKKFKHLLTFSLF
jgi:hypothetical protein